MLGERDAPRPPNRSRGSRSAPSAPRQRPVGDALAVGEAPSRPPQRLRERPASQSQSSRTSLVFPTPASPRIVTRCGCPASATAGRPPATARARSHARRRPGAGRSLPADASATTARTSRRHATPPGFPFASTVFAGELEGAAAAATVRSPTRISPGRRGLLEPRADVDGIPGRRRAALARPADDHFAGVDADTEREATAEDLSEPRCIASAACSARSAWSSCAAGAPKAGHHRVAGELLDRPAGTLDLGRHRLVEADQKCASALRVRGGGEDSRADQVREDDRRRACAPRAGLRHRAAQRTPGRTAPDPLFNLATPHKPDSQATLGSTGENVNSKRRSHRRRPPDRPNKATIPSSSATTRVSSYSPSELARSRRHRHDRLGCGKNTTSPPTRFGSSGRQFELTVAPGICYLADNCWQAWCCPGKELTYCSSSTRGSEPNRSIRGHLAGAIVVVTAYGSLRRPSPPPASRARRARRRWSGTQGSRPTGRARARC